jgi:hypothetical protein
VAVADPRNLHSKAFITNITAEVENDQRESVMKLAQAHEMLAKIITTTTIQIVYSVFVYK